MLFRFKVLFISLLASAILFGVFISLFPAIPFMEDRAVTASYAGFLNFHPVRFTTLSSGVAKSIQRSISVTEIEQKRRFFKSKFGLNFKMTSKGPFIIAYRCSSSRVKQINVYTSAFYQQVYPRYFKEKLREAIAIVYFKNKAAYVRHGGVSAYGHYSYADKALYTYAGSGYGTLWHELIHAFVDANSEKYLPRWFGEGFASFYEMGALHKGVIIEGYTNWRMPSLKNAIRKGSYIPLDRFMRMDTMEYHVGYAEARFLFCYLWMHRKMIPFVKSFLYEISPRYSGKELGDRAVKRIEELLGKNIKTINRELRALALRVNKNQKLYRK